jgi:hypothetical protein
MSENWIMQFREGDSLSSATAAGNARSATRALTNHPNRPPCPAARQCTVRSLAAHSISAELDSTTTSSARQAVTHRDLLHTRAMQRTHADASACSDPQRAAPTNGRELLAVRDTPATGASAQTHAANLDRIPCPSRMSERRQTRRGQQRVQGQPGRSGSQ